MNRVAIVTAMPTEIWPLIRKWKRTDWQHAGRRFRFFESDEAVALCGGIGYEAGERAAEAMIVYAQPSLIIAAGLAGGLKPHYTLGQTLTPSTVIDASTGASFSAIAGEGTVVSSRTIASVKEKRELAAQFGADIVDMEGAAVASVAKRYGVALMLAKAVSDELEFDFPPLNPFVDADGGFRMLRFTLHAAVRPLWWPGIAALKRHSDRAAESLTGLLRQLIEHCAHEGVPQPA